MRVQLVRVGLMAFLGILVSVTGCGYVSQYTNGNGDSGSTLSAIAKLQKGAIGELNSMEWQLLCTELPNLIEMAASMGIEIPISDDVVLPTLTDEQAQVLVDFLKEYNVQTLNDAALLADQVAMGEVELPEELEEFWEALVEQLL